MILATSDQVPGKRITEVKGLVQGNTIRARNIGRDIVAGLRNIVGGEVTEYTRPHGRVARAGHHADDGTG